MNWVQADGKRIRVHREGAGQPIFYLQSGTGEFGAIPLFRELAGRAYEVVAPEFPGFGKSDPPTDWRKVEDVVYHLRQVWAALELERAVVMGASFGGWMAAEFASWFPERLDALVLAGAAGLRVDGAPAFDGFLASEEETMMRSMPFGGNPLEWVAPALDEAEREDMTAVITHFLNASATIARIGWNPMLHDPKLPGRLKVIKAPTLILWGSDDGMIPTPHGELYRDLIPGARLKVIERSGHAVGLEHPHEVAEEVAKFLDSVAVTSTA